MTLHCRGLAFCIKQDRLQVTLRLRLEAAACFVVSWYNSIRQPGLGTKRDAWCENGGQRQQMKKPNPDLVQTAPAAWQSARDAVVAENDPAQLQYSHTKHRCEHWVARDELNWV